MTQPEAKQLNHGNIFNKQYEITSTLGAGAFGTVYKATQYATGQDVALKLLQLPGGLSESALKACVVRFKREMDLCAHLHHPHIVRLIDAGPITDLSAIVRQEAQCYAVYAYVPGQTLQQVIGQEGALHARDVVHLMLQVLDALSAAHRMGVVHRDLKPANIMITQTGNQRHAIVLDFGISMATQEAVSEPGDSLTQIGQVLCTPSYAAPEQLCGEPVTTQADMYAWGLICLECLTGQHVMTGRTQGEIIKKQLSSQPIAIPGYLKGTAWQAILTNVLAKNAKERTLSIQKIAYRLSDIVSQPLSKTGVNGLPLNSGLDRQSLQRKVSESTQDRTIIGPSTMGYNPVCPYQGLLAFQVEHAPLFFGRELLINQLLNELSVGQGRSDSRFMALIGPSGSGKSSLAQAGLIAALQQGGIAGSSDWPIFTTRPDHNPIESLAIALAQQQTATPDIAVVQQLMQDLENSSNTLHLAIKLRAPKHKDNWRAVIFVDQFEEIFTLCQNATWRQSYIGNLIEAATTVSGHVIVVLTLRADFYGHCAPFPNLARALSIHSKLIGPMTEPELRAAIEQPAKSHGFGFESGLIETLVAEVQNNPGALPLLQDTLTSLWSQRKPEECITYQAYRALGELTGTLKQRADQVFDALTPEQQRLCRSIFTRLTQLGRASEDTKKRVAISELTPSATASEAFNDLIKILVDRRLITTKQVDSSHGSRGTAEVSHEALIHGWPRLQEWLHSDREALWFQQQLGEAVTAWQKNEYESSYLYTGARLIQAEAWAETLQLNDQEQIFLDASIQQEKRARALQEQQREQELRKAQETAKRIRLRNKFITATAAAAVALAVMAIWFFNDARTQSELAMVQRDRVLTARDDAEDLISFLINDLRNDLEALGRIDILEAANNKALAYFTQVENIKLGPTRHTMHSQMLRQIASVQMMQGKFEDASSTLQKAEQKIDWYLQNTADINREVLIELSVVYFSQGNIFYNKGQYENALQSFMRQLTIAQKILDTDPNSLDALEQLSNSHNNIGAMLQKINRIDEAMEQIHQSITIKQQLVAREPNDVTKQQSLSDTYMWYAGGFLEQGQLNEAVVYFDQALAVLAPLIKTYPNDLDVRTRFIRATHGTAVSQLYLSRNTRALSMFKTIDTELTKMLELEPDNVEKQQLFARNNQFLGITYRHLKRYALADTMFKASLAMYDRLCNNSESNTQFQLLRAMATAEAAENDIMLENFTLSEQRFQTARAALEELRTTAIHAYYLAHAYFGLSAIIRVQQETPTDNIYHQKAADLLREVRTYRGWGWKADELKTRMDKHFLR